MLKSTPPPSSERAVALYAASLVTLRHAIPRFEPEAQSRLASIDWKRVAIESNLLGSSSRLAVFFQVASGARPASAWTELRRTSQAEGHVYVLEPAQVLDQMLPGLWLDERSIVTGASASQLAYAIAVEMRKTSTARFPYDVQSTALLLEEYPAEVAAGLKDGADSPGVAARDQRRPGGASHEHGQPAGSRLPARVVPAGRVGAGGTRGDRRVFRRGIRRQQLRFRPK